ncbi:MAG TPA: hypothetical protein V6C71_19800 [Coleofasciculaceae cyanobacterium]
MTYSQRQRLGEDAMFEVSSNISAVRRDYVVLNRPRFMAWDLSTPQPP